MTEVAPAVSASRFHRRDDEVPPPRPSRAPAVSGASVAHHERVMLDFVRNRTEPAGDGILYLGMRDTSASKEIAALGSDATRVPFTATSDVSHAGKSYDLGTLAGVQSFTRALEPEIGSTARAKLEGILCATDASCRDEVAQIAIAWAPAYGGGTIPSRLVLSGHSMANVVWGDDATKGMLTFAAVRVLAEALPHAANQIEDIHFAACNTENNVQADLPKWQAAFPNLKTIWAYAGTAPEAATADLAAWRAATNGHADRFDPAMLRRHPNVTVWTATQDVPVQTVSLEQRRWSYAAAEGRFEGYVSGDLRVANPHEPTAEKDYIACLQLAAHAGTPAADRDTAMRRAQQMLCLRFWETSVRAEIATHYGSELGFDVSTMTRKEAVTALAKLGTPLAKAILDLDPKTIPSNWAHDTQH